MSMNGIDLTTLPMLAMKEIPRPEADAKHIVGLVKSGGKITGYKLSDGTTLDKQAGVALARQGGISGVGISERNGTEYLKALPDGSEGNNLSGLPTVN